MNRPTFDLVDDVFAAYRLTRLVSADVITGPIRGRIVRDAYRRQAQREHTTLSERVGQAAGKMRWSEWDDLAISEGDAAPKLATLVTCRWCAGFYVSVFVVLARRYRPTLWQPVARTFALSAASALVARGED